jgi:hypothetical protein
MLILGNKFAILLVGLPDYQKEQASSAAISSLSGLLFSSLHHTQSQTLGVSYSTEL